MTNDHDLAVRANHRAECEIHKYPPPWKACTCDAAQRMHDPEARARLWHEHRWTVGQPGYEACACGAARETLVECPQCCRLSAALHCLVGSHQTWSGCDACYRQEVDRLFALAHAAQKASENQREGISCSHEQEDLASHAQADEAPAGDADAGR